MGIARSTYYDRPAISIDDTELVETMAAISESFEAYGYRRMQAALRHRGLVVNHKKIRRLMREHSLQPRRRRRYVATTDGDHELPIFPNLAKVWSRAGRTSSGWPTSPMLRSPPASSTSPSSSMPGRARSSVTLSADRSTSG
ncbi:IS3 family transposase [Bosea sp. OAE506]|uniref:IS3 family transposase n=1 Tax=Bosea sp. OAE506 TaxID=2663870 RepID=UPI0033993BFC